MLLIDVDAAVKLAHWDLLDGLSSMFGKEWREIATIGSLRYRAERSRKNPDGRLFRSAMAAKNVLTAMVRMGNLPKPDASCLAAFQDFTDIDPGEAVLFSILRASEQSRLLSGDKRALRALARLDPNICHTFRGRIFVVEQILLKLLETNGFNWLRAHVCQDTRADTAVAICMGSRCDAAEESVVEGLRAYIAEMESLINPPLLGQF